MLYHIFYEWLYEPGTIFSACRVFQYITFRAAYATITALIISLIIAPWIIKILKGKHIQQVIRKEYLHNHVHKADTPTMGGIIILIPLLISSFLWSRFDIRFTWIIISVTLGLGLIGFVDDYLKLVRQKHEGLVAKYKFSGQVILASVLAIYLYYNPIQSQYGSCLSIPFFKGLPVEIGLTYILLVVLIIVGTSNAVNLTDGLDGLAIGAVIFAAIGLAGASYFAGHFKFANYLKIIYVSGAGEITVYLGALIGASVGFLWYNAYPANVFMGDTGSLALGGILGTAAVLIKNELLLLIIGGLFVIEALSVILQVGSVKLFQRRIFKMAPIHHHFEREGWSEPKIIVRFWIIAGIFTLLSLSTLKLR
ncbi:MAG: phospho-N-acetylmuramoyl-pentapeptide-transferase [bacterium]|nr:phospho-N-acetylmuramoyl-pentapeptide-transferase [bacterium]